MAAPLTEAYRVEMARLRDAAANAAGTAWDALDTDTSDPSEYLGLVVPVVTAAQAHSAVLTDAYLTRAAGVAPIGVTLDAIAHRLRGVDPEEVYERPFHSTWWALSRGEDAAKAVASGRARAVMTAATDVALAMRASAWLVGKEVAPIQAFVRVTSGGCDLCSDLEGDEMASADEMPLHPNCGCTVEPVVEDSGEFSGAPSEPPEEGSPAPERESGTVIHDHGELGPLLANAGDEFREE